MLDIPASTAPPDLSRWYQRNRQRSRMLFDLIDPDVYYTRPIALRNPIVFYEGHLPAFSVIAFLKRGLGHPGVDDRLEALFARGIDPDSEASAVPRSGADTRWPPRDEVLAYGQAVDRAVAKALEGLLAPASGAGGDERSARDDERSVRDALFTALEHEAMHQETLLYMWRRLPHAHKRRPPDLRYDLGDAPPAAARVQVHAGTATLGARREERVFGWDNEFGELVIQVPGFHIDVHSVTNEDFLAFLADRGYERSELWSAEAWDWRTREEVGHPVFWTERGGEWFWRGMFEDIRLPKAWPVYVSQAEAAAYARWQGRRLPTEAEYHRAAFGTPDGGERALPWGATESVPADGTAGNFDFQHWEPVPAGACPAGASAWGVHDLIGNGWEWTSSPFVPFPGFAPMATYPEYSVEFFDEQHYVLKGASPGTARELVRRSFRNWFRPTYPYVYAKFRTVSSAGAAG